MTSIKTNLDTCFPDVPENYKLKKTFMNVLNYVHKQDWMGACHATTAIMYILYKEQGYDVNACIGEVGEVGEQPIIFDHSWIEIDGKVIDVSISNTLIEGLKFPPIFMDIDLISLKNTKFEYGIAWGNGFDEQAEWIFGLTLGAYMEEFPGHPNGLWGIAKNLAKNQGLKMSFGNAKRKWSDDNWTKKS